MQAGSNIIRNAVCIFCMVCRLVLPHGNTPPNSLTQLLLLGGCDTPLAKRLVLLQGVDTPQAQIRTAAAFHYGDIYNYL